MELQRKEIGHSLGGVLEVSMIVSDPETKKKVFSNK
jgi:hypothetical protein